MNNTKSTISVYSGTSSNTWVGSSTTLSGTFSGSSTTTVASNTFIGYSSVVSKVKYVVLGKEIEVEGYKDAVTALYISMINLHGKVFYDEVKKQGVDFPREIEDYLKIALIPWERDKKLDTLL